MQTFFCFLDPLVPVELTKYSFLQQSYDSQLHPHDCNDYFSHRPLMIEHNSASQVCGRKVFIAAELGEHEHSFLAEVIVGLKAKYEITCIANYD